MAFKVGDKYRTNDLSLRPGGYTVIVQHDNGAIYEYDKIKNPAAYIRSVSKLDGITNAWVKTGDEIDTGIYL